MGEIIVLRPVEAIVLLGEARNESDRLLVEMLALFRACSNRQAVPDDDHDRLVALQAQLADARMRAEHLATLLEIIERDSERYRQTLPEGTSCCIVSEKGPPANVIELAVTRSAATLVCVGLRFRTGTQ